ncbi:MAG TPA: TetR/AcrR family transcriptional regulator [Kineosporiaceae bacterium]|nr:TetR/AcrR family transcriptional regulator [Kineosporiaceae bacterium]
MATRDDWIQRGLQTLAQEGLPGVRIDRIAAALGVSKGSFHHHFAGASAYREALVHRYEEQALTALHRNSETWAGLELLEHLLDELDDLYDARLETAVRAWAMHDPLAHQVLSRVDDARLRLLQGAWSALIEREDAAHLAALVPHLIIIGASAAAIPPADLRAVLQLLASLAPSVPAVLDNRSPVGPVMDGRS